MREHNVRFMCCVCISNGSWQELLAHARQLTMLAGVQPNASQLERSKQCLLIIGRLWTCSKHGASASCRRRRVTCMLNGMAWQPLPCLLPSLPWAAQQSQTRRWPNLLRALLPAPCVVCASWVRWCPPLDSACWQRPQPPSSCRRRDGAALVQPPLAVCLPQPLAIAWASQPGGWCSGSSIPAAAQTSTAARSTAVTWRDGAVSERGVQFAVSKKARTPHSFVLPRVSCHEIQHSEILHRQQMQVIQQVYGAAKC